MKNEICTNRSIFQCLFFFFSLIFRNSVTFYIYFQNGDITKNEKVIKVSKLSRLKKKNYEKSAIYLNNQDFNNYSLFVELYESAWKCGGLERSCFRKLGGRFISPR